MSMKNLKDNIAEIEIHVIAELNDAIKKHGVQSNISVERQFLITAEEFGEVAMAINDGKTQEAKEEIIQTIAMLYKLYWRLD